MIRNVLITKHRKYYPVLQDFRVTANSSQRRLVIDLLDLPQRQRVPFFAERLNASDLRKAGIALKANYGIRDDDLLIITVDGLVYDDEEGDDDLFSLCSDDLSVPGLAIISFNYLKTDPAWSTQPQDLVANSIMLNLVCSLAENLTKLRTHTEPSGCIMDYCYEMSEIAFALKNGFSFCVRNGCLAKLQQSEEGRAVAAIAAKLSIEPRATLEQLREIEEGAVVYVKPRWIERHPIVDENLCFVLMPIKKGWTEGVWKKIVQIVEAQDLKALRADDIFSPSEIMNDIWKALNTAKVVIADLSGRNVNVFYELGIAHTLGKTCILIAQSTDDVPFDVAQSRILFYSNDADGIMKLERELPKYIRSALSAA